MKATIGVYDTHEKAVQAAKTLKEGGVPISNISLVGKAENIKDDIHVKSVHLQEAGTSLGVVSGSVLGILTGVGIFAIPGFGFLYGAGALVGAMAGFDLGLVGGGILAFLAKMGINTDQTETFNKHLNEGMTLVIAHGSEHEINNAKEILHTHDQHTSLETH